MKPKMHLFQLLSMWLVLPFLQSSVLAIENLPRLQTNQAYVDQLLLPDVLKIEDVTSVLQFVMNSLPDEVKVYPTENYFYFNFHHGGLNYKGNLRLDASDRDVGKIHFAYFSTESDWGENLKSVMKVFSLKDGVKVESISPLSYRVTLGKRSVLFRLNDLSDVRPPAQIMSTEEQYIGPVFDESALQFFLIYNKSIKKFYYILNSLHKIPDVLVLDKTRPHIHVAQRSGFVFYQDHFKDRLILIGVYEHNVIANNYFDGPFDQLPDNFIKGDMLKDAFIDQNPALKGKIDRFGNAPNGKSRISISPYFHYQSIDELYGFDDCAQKYKTTPKKYYSCFDAIRLSVQ